MILIPIKTAAASLSGCVAQLLLPCCKCLAACIDEAAGVVSGRFTG